MNGDWTKTPKIPAAIAPFVDAIRHLPDFPQRLTEMIDVFSSRLDKSEAISLSVWARALAPDDPWIWHSTQTSLDRNIPRWHWTIARDALRNEIYDRAIRANITPDSMVLEVGTGSGILAMMAARAGARHVYTIEIVPVIAEAARANIAANGFADRITVITADALTVAIGEHLPERCNVFLHEILSNDLLAENVLALSSHVRQHLLTQDAAFLPETIWATAQLIEPSATSFTLPIGEQAGFDLSALDILYSPRLGETGPVKPYQSRSKAKTVLSFDLTGNQLDPERDTFEEFIVTNSGQASYFLQWIGFSFPDGTVYENPPNIASSWYVRYWQIPPVQVQQGDRVRLRLRYDDLRMILSLAETVD